MRRLTLAIMLAAFSSAALATTDVDGLPQWPGEMQGPDIPGLHPHVYGIWRSNRNGTDVCFNSMKFLQPVCIAMWARDYFGNGDQ